MPPCMTGADWSVIANDHAHGRAPVVFRQESAATHRTSQPPDEQMCGNQRRTKLRRQDGSVRIVLMALKNRGSRPP